MAGVSTAAEAGAARTLVPTISIGGDKTYPHPSTVKDWVDDMKKWPQVEKPQILYYLVKSKACDLKDANAFRSMQSFTYMQSGWVGALFVHEIDEALVLLKGEVRASQALATYHNAWVCCERSGAVITGGCTCMAGQGKVCSHVGALLWKVDLAVLSGFTGEGCTDKTAGWNKGTKRNMEPTALEDINFKVAERTIDEDAPRKTLPSLPRLCGNDEELAEFYKNCPFQEILRQPGSLFYATMTAPPWQPQQRADAMPTTSHGPHEDTNSLPGACSLCNNFYERYINLGDAAAGALEAATRTQNHLWHTSRRLRITASNVKKIPKRTTTPTQKAVQALTAPTFHGNAATQHGINHEAVARQQVESYLKTEVQLKGIHVCKERPWLSATPDGVVECRDAILEIKCPFVDDCRDLILSKRYDVVEKDGTYKLSENGPNGYYAQVQYTMLCTGKSLCLFYVWSLKASILVEVPFNAAYIEMTTPRLRRFYFNAMLPCLEKMHRDGKLDLGSQYEQLAEL
ncbi:uncharacterized protein LOC144168763 isoform X2 [Haemaphysalis longicornis]